jgi:Spy/CpxP family protein refolding chaperone
MKTIALSITLLAFAATGALAQSEAPFGPSGASSSKVDDIARKLSLTPKQRRKLRAIRDTLRKTEVKTRAAIEVVRIDLSRELDSDKPNRSKVGSYITKISSLEASARKAKVFASLSIRELLSKSQWEQLQNRRGRHGRHHMRDLERKVERELRRELRKHRRDLQRFKREIELRKRDMERRKRDMERHKRNIERQQREMERQKRRIEKRSHRRSRIHLRSDPSGASVYLDGKKIGYSPVSMRVRAGRHRITLVKKGHKKHTRVLAVEGGNDMQVQVRMSADR